MRDDVIARGRFGGPASTPHLVDTTMFYAPRSGGVKRYLTAKRAWFAEARPDVRHTLVVPGATDRDDGRGLVQVASPRLPFGRGYRWPTSRLTWADSLEDQRPTLIEAGDPYGPGMAALEAGRRLGVPVVGFCHSDPAMLAALHFGAWAEKPVRKRWERFYRRFDRVAAPSRHIAGRLDEAGVEGVIHQPLGVDVDTFSPHDADPAGLRRRLGLPGGQKLLVFAGRPAKEKRIDTLVETAEMLGDGYTLVLVGAGEALLTPGRNTICLPYERDARKLAGIIASCDAFVHANEKELFGLIVLEALACGVPVAGIDSGGVAELIDDEVGRLAADPSPAGIAEAVRALFATDMAQMHADARRRAVERHGWGPTFEALCGVYAEACGRSEFFGHTPLAA